MRNRRIVKSIDINSTPIALDLKIYGQNLILGTRQGVFEASINFLNEETSLKRKLSRVFDSKCTHLSAKAGEVFISSVDGLFRSTYWSDKNRLTVEKKSLESTSLKTNWHAYNLVNFKDSTKFRFYCNRTEKVVGESLFAQDEGEATMMRINEFGFKQFVSDSYFSNTINLDDILFVFNSNTNVFVVFKNGTFKNYGISLGNNDEKDFQAIAHEYSLPALNVAELGKPLNALTVPTGTLVEFFDRVILAKKGLHIIENQAVSSMRTYPNSVRYRNIITTFKEDSLTITALNPFY